MTGKRLLICTPTHNLHGGVERILESLAYGLPAYGFEVVFGLAKGLRFHDPARFRAEYPRIDTVEIDGTSGTATGRQRSMRKVMQRVDPDLILIARLFDAYPAAAELKTRGHKLRLTITIQSYEPEYFIDAQRYHQFIDLCVASGTTIRIAASRISQIPADRVADIPGGAAPARRERRPADVLRLGFVGRIQTVQKRALDLADTLAELRRRDVPFRCVVAGTGSEEPELRRRIEELGMAGDVAFAGWQSPDQLYEEIYPDIDVLLHFAEFEGLPIVPREAMANGVVPVISRYTGIQWEDDFREGVTALTFPVGDTRTAADCVESLHRDRQLLARLSAAARASQGGPRSAEGAIAAWAQALDDTLARPPRVGPLPDLPPVTGRLERFLRPRAAESLRRAFGIRFEHRDAGSEWPHWSGADDPSFAVRMRQLAEEADPVRSALALQ